MQRHGRAPAGFDSLGKRTRVEKLGPGCWRSGCLQAASPCWGQGEISSFSSCLRPRHTGPRARPSLLSVPARIAAGFCFNAPSPDAGQHRGGVAGTGPAPSSPRALPDPHRAAGCSEADAGSPGHCIVPCPGCLAPLPLSRRAGTLPVLPLARAAVREGGTS